MIHFTLKSSVLINSIIWFDKWEVQKKIVDHFGIEKPV